jgi:hypothetical protein
MEEEQVSNSPPLENAHLRPAEFAELTYFKIKVTA